MACNFEIPFSEAPAEAVVKARNAVESQQGVFNGDERAGNFEVTVFGNTIRGHYTVQGQVLHLTITEKPFLVPCSMIESFLKSHIS